MIRGIVISAAVAVWVACITRVMWFSWTVGVEMTNRQIMLIEWPFYVGQFLAFFVIMLATFCETEKGRRL